MGTLMFFCSRKLKMPWVLVAILFFSSRGVLAQDKNEEALEMVSSAMDAYSNLEMDRAKEILEEALAMADELDGSTLAKVHSSLGVLAISGFSDTPIGEDHFIKAICLDPEVKVDPLFSTPEIDLVFTQSKESATPEKCEALGIVPDQVEITVPPCGRFSPPERQRSSYEIPFYVEMDGRFRFEVTTVVLHYSFDSGRYTDLDLSPRANGYGSKIECERHEIRRANPRVVTFYLEGFSAEGELLCEQGSEAYPLSIEMAENAAPPAPIAGLKPEKCVQCSDDDEVCKHQLMEKLHGDKKDGEPCTSDMDCIVDLMCDPEMFVCTKEPIKKKTEEDGPSTGPSTFYVTLSGGTGVGFLKKDLQIKKTKFNVEPKDNYDPRNLIGMNFDGDPTGQILEFSKPVKGFTWSGVPVRLALGVHINPKLSIEVSGRFDVFLVSHSTPVSCFEAADNDINQMLAEAGQDKCSYDFDDKFSNDEDRRTVGQAAVSWEPTKDGHTSHLKKEYQFAWLVNARVRYKALSKGSFVGSVFGGVGYGTIQYRVKDTASGDFYFPIPGMVDIEIGPGVAYYFSKYAGITFDVPIDFIVGDGFAFNIDFNLGMSVGF